VKITRQLLRQWEACYEDDRIAELVPPDGLTPLQVATSGHSEDDLIWVLFREEIIPALEMRKLANRWARRCLEATPLEKRDLRVLESIRASEQYAAGERTALSLKGHKFLEIPSVCWILELGRSDIHWVATAIYLSIPGDSPFEDVIEWLEQNVSRETLPSRLD